SLANVELERQDVDAAMARLESLSVEIKSSPSLLAEARYYGALGECYRRKGMFQAAITAFEKSIDRGVVRVASLSSASEKAGVLSTIENSYRGIVAAMVALTDHRSAALRTWETYRTLDAAGAPVRRERSDAGALSFVELPDGFAAWISVGDQVIFHRIPVRKDFIARLVSRFRRECSDPGGDSRALESDARQLHRWLVEPFQARLPSDQDQEFIVELDGALSGVPLQALASAEGRYLGNDYSLMVSSGYSAPGRPTNCDVNSQVVAFINPTIKGDSARRFPLLPDSLNEADAIRAVFPAATLFVGQRATTAALAGAVSGAEVVHFAGHGYASSENGGLLFAPPAQQSEDYDLVQSADLMRLDWSRCRLAVLSACATAAGETNGPHNPESLVRALARAGVPRVVASLWSVDSAATAGLMKAFYEALSSGEPPSRALRRSQEWVRRQPGWSHPYYWAGFQLYGTR
ncbi:MAG TPA: CHAT domain-containing protein, partial [Blastocatellia bacterium]|nr:CHAT domain-containing protein [Blastocatellia bacterium]